MTGASKKTPQNELIDTDNSMIITRESGGRGMEVEEGRVRIHGDGSRLELRQ